jgi:hypothetical protein
MEYTTHIEEMRNTFSQKFYTGYDTLGDLGVNGKLSLKWI